MTRGFDPVLGRLIAPALDRLAVRLGSVPGLDRAEGDAVLHSAEQALLGTLHLKVSRVLALEVNAARVSGRLTAPDPRSRWEQWLQAATSPGYWESLAQHYPTLLPRLKAVVDNRCEAALAFATRFAGDRANLPGSLLEVEFGAGDSHRGGQTVAIVRCEDGRIVYKPRSLAIDAALARFVSRLLPDGQIRVPPVLAFKGYGWAAYEAHRYCAGDGELRAFYSGLGQWIAVMRLLGGSDLHAENLIAVGPVPVVVDCETLFTPQPEAEPSGYGHAIDRANDLLGGSVLRTGLLPGRGVALAWRGIDLSAAGALPDQQPTVTVPALIDEGTDLVRVGFEQMPILTTGNHPSPDAVLDRYWGYVADAFDVLTDRLYGMDRDGQLAPLLEEFDGCPVRFVRRSTESYAELGRMLWHPSSLHDEAAARDRAADLLARQAKNLPEAASEPEVIAAEIDDLLVGDVPFFGIESPSVQDALDRWRTADLGLDRQVIRGALVSAYLNESPPTSEPARMVPALVRSLDLDRRRRRMATEVIGVLGDAAVRGDDGTVTWIAPVLTAAGWSVQPLSPDIYLGTTGIAVLLAAYQHETRAGRADPLDEVPELLDGVLRTMRASEDRWEAERAGGLPVRPLPSGGYVGLGSQVWAWLLLRRLGIGGDEALLRARALAEQIPESVRTGDSVDLLQGAAGAIVPLLRLSEHDGDSIWVSHAESIGKHLGATARFTEDGLAWWPGPLSTDELGGVSHGATGIAWALSHLGSDLAAAGFAYEESLYRTDIPGWLDMRKPERPTDAAAWCHGAGGIGIVAVDMLRRDDSSRDWADVLGRAADICWRKGMGITHTLCHGDLGTWELLRAAGFDREKLDAHILTSLEDFGAVAGPNGDAFRPGLLLGLGGIAYQLMRMHPACPLPSVLLPDPGPLRPIDG